MTAKTEKNKVHSAEEWLPVVGFEGDYEVSSYGRVRAVERHVKHRYGTAHRQQHLMTPTVGKRGYCMVSLHKSGKLKTCSVHRLVAKAFLPYDHERQFVNHKAKNGDKTNNHVDNLEWVTRSENARHLFDVLGFKGSRSGERGKHGKRIGAYGADGSLYKEYVSGSVAAAELGVSPAAISACLNGKSKSCAGYTLAFIPSS